MKETQSAATVLKKNIVQSYVWNFNQSLRNWWYSTDGNVMREHVIDEISHYNVITFSIEMNRYMCGVLFVVWRHTAANEN